MSTKLICGIVGVITLTIGCSYESNCTFNLDISFSNTSVSSPAPMRHPAQPSYLTVTPSEVASKDELLNATEKTLAKIEGEIATLEFSFAKANQQRLLIPSQIEDLRRTATRLAKEINTAAMQVVTAKQAYSDLAATIESQKVKIEELLATSLTQEYEQAVSDIKLARQKRDELRARIGARPEDQSETQLQSLRIRQARENVQQTCATTLRQEYAKIDAEAMSLQVRVASAQNELDLLKAELRSTEHLIHTSNEELIAAGTTVASLPVRLARLQEERSRLIVAKREQWDDLQLARTALLKKNESLAEQSRQQELETQRSATLAASSQSSSQYYASTGDNGSYEPMNISIAPSVSRPTAGYYNYHYRPPVGNHYVHGHLRNDGTYVAGHRRTDADDSFWNNWSSHGNVNPYTGRVGTKLPSYNYGGGSSYVRGYFRSNGTYVSGHYRRN